MGGSCCRLSTHQGTERSSLPFGSASEQRERLLRSRRWVKGTLVEVFSSQTGQWVIGIVLRRFKAGKSREDCVQIQYHTTSGLATKTVWLFDTSVLRRHAPSQSDQIAPVADPSLVATLDNVSRACASDMHEFAPPLVSLRQSHFATSAAVASMPGRRTSRDLTSQWEMQMETRLPYYCVGDSVEIFSASRRKFYPGNVLEVKFRRSSTGMRQHLLVKYGDRTESAKKWIDTGKEPQMVRRTPLRHTELHNKYGASSVKNVGSS